MSSFVIDKKQLKRAAGFVSALSDYDMTGGRHLLWWYDCQRGKRADKDTFKALFEKVHLYNALSVQKQYRDAEPEIDSELYNSDFEEAYKDTKKQIIDWTWSRGNELEKSIFRFHSFCSSILYQIESEEESEAASAILHALESAVFGVLQKVRYLEDDCTSWGRFSLNGEED